MGVADDLQWVRERLGDAGTEEGLDRLARQTGSRIKGDADDPAARACKVAMALWESTEPLERRLAVRLLRRFAGKLPNPFWSLFRKWIQGTRDEALRDEISEWLVGALVCSDRSWLLVLRHWSEKGEGPLRRAGVIGGIMRVRTMSDLDAAFLLAEPLMRIRDKGLQVAVTRLLDAGRKVDKAAVDEFVRRWGARASSWMLQAAPKKR